MSAREGSEMNPQFDIRTLNRRKGIGWRCYATSAATETEIADLLMAFAQRIGTPLPGRNGKLIEPITPQNEQSAEARSLSAIHGLGEMPLHMDSGHRLKPARLLLIGCVAPGRSRAQTRLVDTRRLIFTPKEMELLSSAPFLIRTGRRSFYSTILDRSRPFMRYDPGCMEPIEGRGEEAVNVMQRALAQTSTQLHDWFQGEILMIDNWRMLHGRTPAAADGRLLLRVGVQ